MNPEPLNHRRLGHLLVALAVLTLSLCGPAPAPPPEPATEAIEPLSSPAAPPQDAKGEFAFPATAAGRLAAALWDAYEADDEEALRGFVASHSTAEALARRPVAELVAEIRRVRQQLGSLRPHQVLEENAGGLTLLLHAERGEWVRIRFVLTAETPPKLASVNLEPALPPELETAELSAGESLAELLEKGRSVLGLPGLAAAWVAGGEIVEQAAVGVRSVAGQEAVTIGDLFQIGSVTKSMTATMIGQLVEDGLMAWDDTVGEVLADLDPRPEYRPVTVVELLGHRGRIPPYGAVRDPRLIALPGSPTEQRTAFVAEVLRTEPLAPGMQYSNAGYAVAGLIAERRAGKSWEELIRDQVFAPLGLSSAGIGWPATAERPDQPRGHFWEGGAFRPQGLDEYPIGAFLAPAGYVHCAIGDLARYAAAHLAGLRGRDGALAAATIRRLHTPLDDGERPYAGGWHVGTTDDGAEQHWHGGSGGTFYALVVLFPEDETAFVLLANAGLRQVRPLARLVLATWRARWKETHGPAQ